MQRRALSLPLVLALILALAACTPATSSESVAPSEHGHSAEPSEHGHSAEPSASEVALCDPGVICNGPLAAGDYVSESTGARVEFTLDDHDWAGLEDTPGDGFGLFLADVPSASMSVVAFDGEIFTDACNPEGTSTIEATPAAFMEMLTSRTGVEAGEVTEVDVGGQPALQVDLTTALDAACEATGGGRIWLWTMPVHGDFHFNDGEAARVIAVDAGGETVILVAEAFSEEIGDEYDHFIEHFGELVDSMTITPL